MHTTAERYDVVIVGASIAGCTAATLLGRAGLRVALLERHRHADTAKALCGHFILGGAVPTLRRLGVHGRMRAAGAVTGPIAMHLGGAWSSVDGPDLPHPINLRRTVLDPMLREVASSTPGVDLRLGHTVTALTFGTSETVVDARTGGPRSGRDVRLAAPLVVAADGFRSPTAALAGVAEDTVRNARFGVMAYYRGLPPVEPAAGRVWTGRDVGICTPTDDGLVLVAAFPHRDRLEEFRTDPVGALERFIAALPDGPDLAAAERASRPAPAWDHPQIRRAPVPRPRLALIGDAATTGDPVPAVGCGWALRSAEWLADAVAPALRGESDLVRSLRRYRASYRFLLGHDALCRAEARARPPALPERLLTAAVHADRRLATDVYRMRMRAVPVRAVANPVTLARGAAVMARGGRRAHVRALPSTTLAG
jgi:menaquinone-9 beta-reductase